MLESLSGSIYAEGEFINSTFNELNKLGFNADNTIACISICRDELCQSLAQVINEKWGYAFNFTSLAGMFWAGRTGLFAAMIHSPHMDGKERYVFYAMSHIAVDEKGRLGYCKRSGRKDESVACGALDVLQKQLLAGNTDQTIDFNDIELSLIKMRLTKELTSSEVPSLFDLTRITQRVIQQDLESAIANQIKSRTSDYAFITGIQIHGPEMNYIWPAAFYAVVDNVKLELLQT